MKSIDAKIVWSCCPTLALEALLEQPIEKGAAVITEGGTGVGIVTKPVLGVIILKLNQGIVGCVLIS